MSFEDDLLALEQRVLADSAGDFFAAVDELRRMLAMGSGGIGSKLLSLAIPDLEAAAKAGVTEAWVLGGAWAAGAAASVPAVDPAKIRAAHRRLDAGVPAGLTAPLVGLDVLLAGAKRAAVALIRSGAEPEVAVAPVFGAATTARARVVTQINASSNAASETVGDAVGSPMVWEAERDACVYCLALAGEVVESAGDSFPAADLYADPPATQETVERPPLHPNCRCRLAVLADRSYAVALRREAQRSILRGFSLPSESQAVRVRAAARLLDRDPVAPQSVKAYAAAAVKAGKFPTRDVPAGGPRLTVNG